MAHQGSCNPSLLKLLSVLTGFCFAAYIVGRPLYWHFAEGLASFSHPCPSCVCDCASDALLAIPAELSNTFPDCGKHDPEANEDLEKNFTDLLAEELKLQEAVALENQQRAEMALLEAKKMASQYQKEADKCNAGMETCEEARERAEAALQDQKKLSAIWEARARRRGWKDGPVIKSQSHP